MHDQSNLQTPKSKSAGKIFSYIGALLFCVALVLTISIISRYSDRKLHKKQPEIITVHKPEKTTKKLLEQPKIDSTINTSPDSVKTNPDSLSAATNSDEIAPDETGAELSDILNRAVQLEPSLKSGDSTSTNPGGTLQE
ncbi:MAG: hypothetical protein JXB34_05650 [Bacteroidales bacterium]|nr:hypothetical protein [Bacteroidales bacterium]